MRMGVKLKRVSAAVQGILPRAGRARACSITTNALAARRFYGMMPCASGPSRIFAHASYTHWSSCKPRCDAIHWR